MDDIRGLLKFKTDENRSQIVDRTRKPSKHIEKKRDIIDKPKKINTKPDFVISEGDFMIYFSME